MDERGNPTHLPRFKYFALLHCHYATHPASYSKSIGERDADQSSSHSNKVQNAWSYTTTPQSSPWYGTYDVQGHQVWPYSEEKLNPYPSPVFIVGIPLRYLMQYLDTRGGTTVNPLISFSVSTITITMQLTYHVHTLYSAEIIFTQSLLHYRHTFSTHAWNVLCRSRGTCCWSVGALHARFVTARRRP